MSRFNTQRGSWMKLHTGDLVSMDEDGYLYLDFVGQPEDKLIPYKGTKFRVQQFSDVLYEFVVENGEVKALKERSPSGESVFTRK